MNIDNDYKERVHWLIGLLYSTLGTCDRLRTSCLIIKDGIIRGFGVNDAVDGMLPCDKIGHLLIEGHCLRTNHGEENAIISTPREDLKGATAQIISTPCLPCIKKLLEAEIARITYVGSYHNALGKEYINGICAAKHVTLEQTDLDWQQLFQEAFNRLTEPGGVFYKAGFRLKITKEELIK